MSGEDCGKGHGDHGVTADELCESMSFPGPEPRSVKRDVVQGPLLHLSAWMRRLSGYRHRSKRAEAETGEGMLGWGVDIYESTRLNEAKLHKQAAWINALPGILHRRFADQPTKQCFGVCRNKNTKNAFEHG